MSEATKGSDGQTPAMRSRKPETPAQKLARLEQELNAAKIEAKEAHERACTIVGRAILAEAEDDGEMKARLTEILRRRVKGNAAKAAIAAVLVELTSAA